MPNSEPGPRPPGTGEALRRLFLPGMPKIASRWEACVRAGSAAVSWCIFLPFTTQQVYWLDRWRSNVSILQSYGTGVLGTGRCTAQRRETVRDISKREVPWVLQPSNPQCWSGLCTLCPVPSVLGSSVGKASQGERDRIWGEATGRPLPAMAGPTSALGSLPDGRHALCKAGLDREVLTGTSSALEAE